MTGAETNRLRALSTLTETDRKMWRIDPLFHGMSYLKRKLIVNDMLDWCFRMNDRIDEEYAKEHNLE